jgi:hypothetical protein
MLIIRPTHHLSFIERTKTEKSIKRKGSAKERAARQIRVNYRVLKGAASHVIANTCITVMSLTQSETVASHPAASRRGIRGAAA